MFDIIIVRVVYLLLILAEKMPFSQIAVNLV